MDPNDNRTTDSAPPGKTDSQAQPPSAPVDRDADEKMDTSSPRTRSRGVTIVLPTAAAADATDEDQITPNTAIAATPSESDTAAPSKQPEPEPEPEQVQEQTDGEAARKKPRLQWDEQNLMSNAEELVRMGPRIKIDEPETPYHAGSASENGSSASESAHQSPPESPAFIPRERLVGFNVLEEQQQQQPTTPTRTARQQRRTSFNVTGSRGTNGGSVSGGNVSDGASSVGSGGRSVHISDDNLGASAGSSPRSREIFRTRRNAHYRNEARVHEWIRLNEMDDDEDDEGTNNGNNNNAHIHMNGNLDGDENNNNGAVDHRMYNGHRQGNDDGDDDDDDGDAVAEQVARRVTVRLRENGDSENTANNDARAPNADENTNGILPNGAHDDVEHEEED